MQGSAYISDDQLDVVGYQLFCPPEHSTTDGTYVDNTLSVQGGGIVHITMPTSSFISYSFYVASGHPIRVGWAIFLAITGAILIAGLLGIGCFGYVFPNIGCFGNVFSRVGCFGNVYF